MISRGAQGFRECKRLGASLSSSMPYRLPPGFTVAGPQGQPGRNSGHGVGCSQDTRPKKGRLREASVFLFCHRHMPVLHAGGRWDGSSAPIEMTAVGRGLVLIVDR